MKELMSYSEKPVSGELALIAECSWWLTDAPGVAVYPDGFADLLVTGLARVYLAGTAKTIRILGSEFGGSLKGLRLKPWIIASIFGVPAGEEADRILPLAEIPSASAKRIASAIGAAGSADELVALLLRALHGQLANRERAVPRMLEHVLARLDMEPVGEIASSIGMTDRHLRRLFVQRIYSMRQGQEELDPALEEQTGFTLETLESEPAPVTYNQAIPIETFGGDECAERAASLRALAESLSEGFLLDRL